MNALTLRATFLAVLALCTASCAQRSATDRTLDTSPSPRAAPAGTSASGGTFTQGESKRCESLSGAAKERCDKEEGTKTEGAQADTASQSTPSAPQK